MTDTDRIHLDRDLPADPETVWRLWTDPDHLAGWFGPHVSLDARPGGTFRERWTKDGRPTVTAGTITICAPPTDLAWTWADDDWTGQTLLTLSFEAIPDGTRLTLVHSGWQTLPAASRDSLREAHHQGWAMHLDSLERYCTTLAGP